MTEPTVWAVTDPQGRVMGLSAGDSPSYAIDDADARMPHAAVLALHQDVEDRPGPEYTAHGYTLSRVPLVTPEALAVVEAAVYTCDFYRQLLGASGHPMYLDELFGKVAAYRAATATLAPDTGTSRDAGARIGGADAAGGADA